MCDFLEVLDLLEVKKKKKIEKTPLKNSVPNFCFWEGSTLALGGGVCQKALCNLLSWSHLRLIPDLSGLALVGLEVVQFMIPVIENMITETKDHNNLRALLVIFLVSEM